MADKKRVHRVTLELSFDRPCGVKHAVAQANDVIHGMFYTTALNPGDPESVKVRRIVRQRG